MVFLLNVQLPALQGHLEGCIKCLQPWFIHVYLEISSGIIHLHKSWLSTVSTRTWQITTFLKLLFVYSASAESLQTGYRIDAGQSRAEVCVCVGGLPLTGWNCHVTAQQQGKAHWSRKKGRWDFCLSANVGADYCRTLHFLTHTLTHTQPKKIMQNLSNQLLNTIFLFWVFQPVPCLLAENE